VREVEVVKVRPETEMQAVLHLLLELELLPLPLTAEVPVEQASAQTASMLEQVEPQLAEM
jgi:hypothetical protein